MNIHSVAAVTPLRTGESARPGKRDAILRAAIDVFAERGFFNAQVADVARAAGIAAGTVYLYFKSKDDLLVSIFERSMKDVLTEGREALRTISDPAERLSSPSPDRRSRTRMECRACGRPSACRRVRASAT